MSATALDRLRKSILRSRSLLSVGIEPSDEYLPQGYPTGIDGHRLFLQEIIAASEGYAAALKVNIAFFESLGSKGIGLLEELRAELSSEAYLILDAKRGDIGSTAQHYARMAFDQLQADAVTLNPLMGSDSVRPFLDYPNRLSILLTLTSNPGASDFLLRGGLYRQIAEQCARWNINGNIAMVVGATRPEFIGEIAALAPGIPMLLPGVGTQGGTVDRVLAQLPAGLPCLLHQTRSLLPKKAQPGEAEPFIRAAIEAFNQQTERFVETLT